MKLRRIFRTTLLTLLTVGVAAVLLLALLPKPPLYSGVTFSSAIVSRDGELLRLTLAADDRYRLRTPLGRIAPSAVDATLLYEDRHFRQHPGLNPFAFELTLLLHFLSGSVLLALIPFTKLVHVVFFPATQLISEVGWRFKPDAGERVAEALGKENQPV